MVVVDRAQHRITFQNDASYPEEAIVGDIVLPGWSVSAAGRTPASVHVVFRKKNDELQTTIYSHVVTHAKATKVEIENFVVALDEYDLQPLEDFSA